LGTKTNEPLHQLGVAAHRLAEGAEDDPELLELALEGRGDRDAVEHRVHGHAGEHLLFPERDAQLLVGL
jgi:hypothetical protein